MMTESIRRKLTLDEQRQRGRMMRRGEGEKSRLYRRSRDCGYLLVMRKGGRSGEKNELDEVTEEGGECP